MHRMQHTLSGILQPDRVDEQYYYRVQVWAKSSKMQTGPTNLVLTRSGSCSLTFCMMLFQSTVPPRPPALTRPSTPPPPGLLLLLLLLPAPPDDSLLSRKAARLLFKASTRGVRGDRTSAAAAAAGAGCTPAVA